MKIKKKHALLFAAVLWLFLPVFLAFSLPGNVPLSSLLALGVLLIALQITLFFYFKRKLLDPLLCAQAFVEDLAAGKAGEQLIISNDQLHDIQHLFRALTLIRNRQQNTENRLNLSYKREQEARGLDTHGPNAIRYRLLARWLLELRAPLSNIDGYSLLLEPAPTPERQYYLNGIRNNCHTIHRQLKRMLEAGGLGDAQSEQKFATFSSHDLLQRLLDFNLFSLAERDIHLAIRVDAATMPNELFTDSEMLFEALNILIRAVARSATAGEMITLSCFRRDDRLIFLVCDERHVPANANLPEYFLRAKESGMKPEEAGNCEVALLGLQFVENQISLLGGKLCVESTARSHTSLSFDFPAAAMTAPEDNTIRTTSFNPPPANSLPEEDARRPLRILLWENEPENKRIFEAFSGRDQCVFDVFADAAEIPDALRQARYDALILAGGSTHDERLEQIQAAKSFPEDIRPRKIILLCAYINETQQRLLEQLAVKHVLLKPLNFAELIPTLRRWCSERPPGA